MGYLALGVIAAALSLFVYKRDILARRLLGREGSKQGINGNQPAKVQDRVEGAHPAEKYVTEKHALSSGPSLDDINGEENNLSPETTPKAHARPTNGDSIPSFTLQEGESAKIERHFVPNAAEKGMVKMFPSLPQQKQPPVQPLMPPPARPDPNSKRKPGTASQTLMSPPSRPPSTVPTFRSSPRPSINLRPPPSAASTLRATPSRSLVSQSTSLAPSNSTLSPSSRSSKKVLLSPGHSPLDWAHLIKHPPTPTFLRGASVTPHLISVPPSLLKYHNGRKGKDAWGVWQGKVYNLTPYMKFHPGGESELMKGAGRERDAERLFLEVHPWVNWEGMLGECLVGILVGEDEVGEEGDGPLEEMD